MYQLMKRVALIIGWTAGLVGVLGATEVVSQEIYKSVDSDGNIVYSDTPISDASEEVDLPELNVEPGVVPRVRVRPSEPEGPSPIDVWITSPENEFVVHQGALSFSVAGETNRALDGSESVQLIVNGQEEGGRRKNLSWVVGNLIRGEYSLQLQLFRDEEIVSTSSVRTIYVRRAFVR